MPDSDTTGRIPWPNGILSLEETNRRNQAAFGQKRARMVRPGYLGIQISTTEYVMPISEANDLIGMINRAKHDG